MIENVITNVNYLLDQNTELKVSVERIGNWLWVSGDTKPVKEELKVLGFYWANAKKSWYHKGDTTKRGGRGFYKSMNDLRANKGTESIR